MKTVFIKKENADHKWYIINAKNMILGKLSTRIVYYLTGKHKVAYTPNIDIGDYLIVINVEKISVTGNKLYNKKYYKHTGYPGKLKTLTFVKLLANFPERILLKSVKGMLPKTKLGNVMLKKLKIYSGGNHPHTAQNPIQLNQL